MIHLKVKSSKGAEKMKKKLTRSKTDRKILGVCGGIAEYFGIDSTLVRVLWILTLLFGGILGVLAYFLCALAMPEKSDIIEAEVKSEPKEKKED